MCGDFNVEPGSDPLRLPEDLGLTERVGACGFAGARTSHYARPGKFADCMLVNDRVVVRAFDAVRAPEVSDHCPLLLDF